MAQAGLRFLTVPKSKNPTPRICALGVFRVWLGDRLGGLMALLGRSSRTIAETRGTASVRELSGRSDADRQIASMFDWYGARKLQGCALTLLAILGREPRTLRTFFEEFHNVDCGKHMLGTSSKGDYRDRLIQ